MNQKGQEFASYRLLIAVIMGLFILMIIISSLGYFDQKRFDVSEKLLKNGFVNAQNNIVSSTWSSTSSDVSPVLVEEILLSQGGYSAGFFTKNSGMKKECVKFFAKKNPAFTVLNNGNGIGINQTIRTDVYFLCNRNSNMSTDCPILCQISFNEKITEPFISS